MFGALLNIFRVPDLRRKVLITLGLLAIYRIGAFVPTPLVDPVAVREHMGNLMSGAGVFGFVDMFSGGAFAQMTIFALGIMPYISASIIIQLLAAVWPKLEKIQKEGEAGRKKITQYTRYSTVGLAFFQGLGIGVWLLNSQLSMVPDHPLAFLMVTAVTMTTGTCFIMWLGEKITQHGIGNGISLIIAIGIVARYPADMRIAFNAVRSDTMTELAFIVLMAMVVVMSALIVINQVASRRVPIQHAQRMVGRNVVRGGNTYIPLKLNTAGVIPVIFSSAILTFPGLILPYFSRGGASPFFQGMTSWLQMNSNHNLYSFFGLESGGIFSVLMAVNLYTVLYVILTVFFCYFYTAITLNPIDLADNLKKSNAFIPGIKPGKHTADYINDILVRITTVGASLLVLIALVPEILYVSFNIPYVVAQMAGGTGLIIVVGVVLDTMKQIESQLLMRHYEGFKFGSGGGIGTGGGRSAARRPAVRAQRPVRGA